MIYFKTIRWQNFLSTGNQFTEVRLDRSPSTLIVGENGAGKSTILDALSFALYGKAFRNINKPQLVNSITQKNCLVECEFTVSNKEYVIRRGLKPAVFEIIQNGTLINQSANIKEYQDLLEKTILKLNFKSFGQIVVLGSANFIPFMQLTAQDRREVIEDLLDIQIFSSMNVLLKEKIADNKASFAEVERQIDLAKSKIEIHERHVKSVLDTNKTNIEEKQQAIANFQLQIGEYQEQIQKTVSDIDALVATIADADKVSRKKTRVENLDEKLKRRVKTIDTDIVFYETNEVCPTCEQELGGEHRQDAISELNKKRAEALSALEELNKEHANVKSRIKKILSVQRTIQEYNAAVTELNRKITGINSAVSTLEHEISKVQNDTSLIEDKSQEISDLNDQIEQHKRFRESLIDQKSILDVSAVLLKDSGIKTRIIRQYVPIMNKLINKYLTLMDFFVHFELNESFVEKIKSRHRDEFTYASFSEGEKTRLDLALLFTWRDISKLRSSVSTNLLILDEIFDSSLDAGGTDYLLNILTSLPSGTNVFVISHKGDRLFDKFHSNLKFEKHKNFSRIV